MAFGLGRGLEALIPNKSVKPVRPDPSTNTGTHELPINAIVPNPHQPRKQFKLPELEELAASIREHGILEPLVVSPGRQAGKYTLIAGERRLRAAELAGLQRVPVVVRQTDDQEKLELALIENIQRQDLNPLEEAKALRKLLRDFGLSQQQVATRVGRSRPAVANCLRLLDLTREAQQALLDERITEGHAKALLAVSGPDQVALVKEIESGHLSVRQTEQRIREILSHKNPHHRSAKTGQAHDFQAEQTARSLSRHLGAKVAVSGNSAGKITIEYHSRAERDRLVSKITGKPEFSLGEEDEQTAQTDRSEFTV